MYFSREALASLILLCVPALAAELPADEKTLIRAEALVREGRSALEGGDLDAARQSFERCLELVAGFPDAHVGLGQIAMRRGRFEDALGNFRAARESYGDLESRRRVSAADRYASAQDELQKVRERLRELEAERDTRELGLGEGSRTPDSSLRRALQELRRRESELEAVREGGEGVVLESPPSLDFLVGNAAFRLGRREEALREWQRCARRDPDFPAVHVNLALLLGQLGRFEEAFHHLERSRALGLEPPAGLEDALRREETKARDSAGGARP